ncbi:BaeS Signal transduction histidine kinase [Candidatus Nanopelagicaceae bacterium]
MNEEKKEINLRSIAKFEITKSQWVLATLALLSILALGISSLTQSKETVKDSAMLSNVESPAASIIFTQRETMVYATRLAQWSNGGTSRRTVQIARSLLAQRLAVIDTSGHSMGSRAKDTYWKALKEADAIVAAAPVGIMPESMHMEVSRKVSPIIDEILAEARKLVVSYQRSIDEETMAGAREIAKRDQISLILFYLSLFFSVLFLLLNVLTNFRNYRNAGKALDEEQRRLEKTISELHQAQSTVTELQNLSDAKNAFIATVNHELRTPLTSIIGYIDIIREENEQDEKADIGQYLETLDRNAHILLNLVESMLTLSKIDSNPTQVSHEKIWLNEVVDNAIFTMKPQAIKSEINLALEYEDEYFVAGDAGQLTQVFINLIGNAVKFSPKDSVVLVSLSSLRNKDGVDCVCVAVKDSGIGIPEEDIEHLFTRFFRAKNAVSEHFQGTGLGLSIVAQVLERHGGSIDVSSKEGVGTTFTVCIPLFRTSEEQMIQDRRGDVLQRAITALEDSTPSNICDVAHEMGGALGFYGFSSAGTELLEFSRSIPKDRELTQSEYEESRGNFLSKLRVELKKIEGERNG